MFMCLCFDFKVGKVIKMLPKNGVATLLGSSANYHQLSAQTPSRLICYFLGCWGGLARKGWGVTRKNYEST